MFEISPKKGLINKRGYDKIAIEKKQSEKFVYFPARTGINKY
jgi:hypothetical protein